MARHRNKSAYAKHQVMANNNIWGPVIIIRAAKTPEELRESKESRKERVLEGINNRWQVVDSSAMVEDCE